MDIDKSVQLFDLVNQQDFDACEKTQPGMESRLYAEGGSSYRPSTTSPSSMTG